MIDTLFACLARLMAPTAWLLAQPPVVGYTLLGLIVCTAIIIVGLALAKLRISPLWAVTIMLPVVAIPLLWVLAYKKWPTPTAR